MTMAENQAILKRNSSRYQTESSGYASLEENEDDSSEEDDGAQQDQIKEGDEPGEKGETVPDKQVDEGVVADLGENGKGMSPGFGQDADQFSQSMESVETTLSDRIKLMATIQDPINVNDGRPRAKSALTPRVKGLGNDPSNVAEDQEMVIRSKSAFASYQRKTSIEEMLPVPYMDHSKPRIVSVGSIGKISLLENISEAKYWEDTIKEEQKKQTVADPPAVPGEAEPEEDKSAQEEPPIEETAVKPVRKECVVNDEEEDIDELIRKEERKRRQKIAMRTYNYMSAALKELKKQRSAPPSPKTAGNSNGSQSDNKNRHNENNHIKKHSSKSNENQRPRHGKSEKLSSSKTRKTNHTGEQAPVSVLSKGTRNSSPKKCVTVEETVEQINTEKKPRNKYEGLLKRMGEDMPTDMRKRMMGEQVIIDIGNKPIYDFF